MKVEITLRAKYNPEVNEEVWNAIKDLEEPELAAMGDELVEKFGLRDVTRALTILGAARTKNVDEICDITQYLDIIVDRLVDDIVDQAYSESEFDRERADKAFEEGMIEGFNALKVDHPLADD